MNKIVCKYSSIWNKTSIHLFIDSPNLRNVGELMGWSLFVKTSRFFMFLNHLHRCITLCIDANVSLKLKFEFSARLHRCKHLCIDATSRCMLCIDARWVCIDANLKEWLKITSKYLGLISNLLESIPMLLYLWKQVFKPFG